MHSRWPRNRPYWLSLAIVVAELVFFPLFRSSIRANKINVEAVARRFPNFTAEQRIATAATQKLGERSSCTLSHIL